ncbi:MAG TPA: Ig-like domain-containing protein, partial [Myxococcaceae bacterium]
GGIIFIRANQLAGAGTFIANGSASTITTDAASGGGAGGTLYLRIAGSATCGTLQAAGGTGGSTHGVAVGPGGGGGGGRILFQKGSGTCAATGTSVIGASFGTQQDPSAPGGLAYGAQAGSSGQIISLPGGFIVPAPPVVATPDNTSFINDATPVYTGTLSSPFPAGTEVILYVDGAEVQRVSPEPAGSWFFTPTTNLPEGPHSVNAVSINTIQGLQSISSPINRFTVDTTVPSAPILTAPADGSTLTSNLPLYSGTAEPGSTVTVVVNGAVGGTAITDGLGAWSLRPTAPLVEGLHTVTAHATDRAGNISESSAPHTFTVDTLAPATPIITTPVNNSITRTNPPLYSGTAEAGSSVTVVVDGTEVGTLAADASGAWSLTHPVSLPEGLHVVKARATDAAGNISADSNTHVFTVDTLAPAAPRVTSPAHGSATNTNPPLYSGTAEAGSSVTVVVDGVAGTTTANASGAWSFTPGVLLPDGPHVVIARAADAAGNLGVDSQLHRFTVDTVAPVAPRVTRPAHGSITSSQPIYSGTAEAGSTVTLMVDGVGVGTTRANASGAWIFLQPELPPNSHEVSALATDMAGNTSENSASHAFTVDTLAPVAPQIITPSHGSTTTRNQPLYSGTAEAGSTVTVVVDVVGVGTTTANASGTWVFLPPPLAEGSHAVKAQALDVAGNLGESSDAHTFTVDTLAPAVPKVLAPVNGWATRNQPLYSGKAEASSIVTVVVDGTAVGTAEADALGDWILAPPVPLADGSYQVSAWATDGAGNLSASSDPSHFRVDTTAPTVPSFTMPAPGLKTQNTQQSYGGKAEAGSTVTVWLNGQPAGTAVASASGDWSITPETALPDGDYTVEASATDEAGNPGDRSASQRLTVDTAPPPVPEVTTPGAAVDSRMPVIGGTAEPHSTVKVWLDGQEAGDITVQKTGAWSFTPTSPLSPGPHELSVTAKDEAGNLSLDSTVYRFTIQKSHYGWSCATTPSLSAAWALWVLALFLRVKRR